MRRKELNVKREKKNLTRSGNVIEIGWRKELRNFLLRGRTWCAWGLLIIIEDGRFHQGRGFKRTDVLHYKQWSEWGNRRLKEGCRWGKIKIGCRWGKIKIGFARRKQPKSNIHKRSIHASRLLPIESPAAEWVKSDFEWLSQKKPYGRTITAGLVWGCDVWKDTDLAIQEQNTSKIRTKERLEKNIFLKLKYNMMRWMRMRYWYYKEQRFRCIIFIINERITQKKSCEIRSRA